MLDPALCNRPISQWLVLKVWFTELMMNEALVIGALVTMLILSLRWRRNRWRFWARGGIVAVLLLYIFVPLPPFETWANAGLVRAVPADSGATADAIVILGRGDDLRELRIDVAAELWRQGRAPKIFASGRGDGPQIVQRLKASGIPAAMLGDEDCSQTTAENAEFTATLLQPQGIERIILVTDPPHMLRSLLTFRRFGFRVTPHFSPLPPLPQREKALIVYREYVGMASYAIRGRFS
jgi:uncharacterized SAM-binding protein YcdF (DUF218 family)